MRTNLKILNTLLKDDLLHIATFLKPIGLNGEIKISLHISNTDIFKSFNSFIIEDNQAKLNIKFSRNQKGKPVVKIKNYLTRTSVEELTGKKIFVNKKKFKKLNKDEYYVIDLINCEIRLVDNSLIGSVIDIDNFGAGDLIKAVSLKGKEFYIPMNKENVVSVNLKENIVFVNPIKGIL